MPVTTIEAQARMEAKLAELAQHGFRRLLIYGAGRHTLKVGAVLGTSPVPIVGVVDDAQAGGDKRLWNWRILSREEGLATSPDVVLLSSDGQEQALYESGGSWFESKGIPVHRLYGEENTRASSGEAAFRDSAGRPYERVPGYRRRVKSGWEEMLSWPVGHCPVPTPEESASAIQSANHRVALMERYLALNGIGLEDKEVLEIGCWDGACCYALASRGCRRVVGIDHQDYFIWNADPESLTDAQRASARDNLTEMQHMAYAAAVSKGLLREGDISPERVELRIDDLTQCNLAPESFDLICSWQTLEHIIPPETGFQAMSRLLRPGGYAFHEFATFGSRAGGHALCTLDFPWGHVRLGDEDVERYLRQYRPDEAEHALRSYRRQLNRLFVGDLSELAESVGLKLVDLTLWLNQQQFQEELNLEHLTDARRHYPSISWKDLVQDYMYVLLGKPR